jgi:hypothetical protein
MQVDDLVVDRPVVALPVLGVGVHGSLLRGGVR